MANITITSTTNAIKVDFGVYASSIQASKGSYRKDKIIYIMFDSSNTFTKVFVQNEREWLVSYGGTSGTFTIDTIDGVAPTSESDLYDKLSALIN